MRPTIPQSNVPSSPSPDPGASLALVAVLFLGLVAASYPLWTAALAVTLLAAALLRLVTRTVRQGHLCVPKTDVCVRVVPR